MSVKFSNNGKTTLSSGVSSSATSIVVADASVFPSITGSEYFYMTLENVSGNVEILKVTSVSSNTLTAVRAQDGTSAISFAAGDKAENRLTAGGLNDVATQADTDTDTTYSVGDGGLTQKNFTTTLKTKLDGIEASANNYSHPSAHAISFITGLQTALDGKVDDSQVLTNVPADAVFTDNNTTYSVGDGGLTQKNFTSTLKTKLDGIEASANNYSHPSAHTISFITGLQTALDGKVDDSQVLTNVPENAVFTDTTYSVGDGGLTQKNFTTTLKTKLDSIATSANNYSHPSAHTISFITGLQTALDGKVDDSQVLTNVPSGALFTDTVYTLPFTDNSANWNTAYGWGDHSTESYATETYVGNQITALVDSSPATMDTLNELAAALGDDPNFATTVSTSIGTKWTQDNTKISNWDTAYGWGNHASAGYLTSYTDTNTTYSAGTGVTLTGTTFSLTDTNSKLNLSGGTLTGNLVVEDSEVHVGDISGDSWTRIKHAQADGYGFNFEHNNATVLVNEQGSTNEALVLGDVDANNANVGLFGISHSGNSGTTWTKKLDLRGDGDLYIGSSAQNKVWHEGTLTTTNKSNYDTAYGWGDHSTEGYYSSANPPPTYSKYLRSDVADTAAGTITFSAGINGFDISNGISGNNFNISGVNQLSINDPGEGIVFQGTTNVTLAAIDDSTDSVMNFANASQLRVDNKNVGTQSVVTTAPTSASGFPNGHVWYVVS